MRATQQIRYAIYGVFDLAYNGGARPVPLLEVGRRQAIPARYLEQIFQRLRRAGLVESKRGPGGGYRLARSPAAIRIADVVRAVQGQMLVLPDAEPSEPASPAFVWELLRADLERALGAHSIADLCRAAAERGVVRAPTEPVAYEI
jgi:Rrf2 family protein